MVLAQLGMGFAAMGIGFIPLAVGLALITPLLPTLFALEKLGMLGSLKTAEQDLEDAENDEEGGGGKGGGKGGEQGGEKGGEKGGADFSISDITRRYVKQGEATIRNIGEGTWVDCGTPENLLKAGRLAFKGEITAEFEL